MKAGAIVGPSDAGKTSLIERRLPRLPATVGSIKSIHHDVDIDEPGTDTYRHRSAGAETVIGVTPSLTFSVTTQGKADRTPEGEVLDQLLSQFEYRGYAYVLVEGFASSSLPKILVGPSSGVPGRVLAHCRDIESADVGRLITAIKHVDAYES
jgi:molybdopterin-guanine dinucleotide biosynthesis protein B